VKQYRILIDCSDKKGLVYKVSKLFYELELNIISNHEFVDEENDKFFMRSVVEGNIEKDDLYSKLRVELKEDINLHVVTPSKKNIVLMVTKESHCLGDILIRYEAGELDANIIAVVSNYDILEPLVKKFDIPFFCVSHVDLNREEHEQNVLQCLSNFKDIGLALVRNGYLSLTFFLVQTRNRKETKKTVI